MALLVTNISDSGLYDPVTNALRTVFTRMDSIHVNADLKMQPVRGGSSFLPAINIGADRDPKVTIKGPELPSVGLDKITGMSAKRASVGSPLILPTMVTTVIGADGKAKLKSGKPISATATTIAVLGPHDGTTYTSVASAPTTGQYVTPIASATDVTFNIADAGKVVSISYFYDSTQASQFSYKATTIPGVQKFIGEGVLTSDQDPDLKASCIIVVPKCQLVSQWEFGAERAKATDNTLELQVLDPGAGQDAVSIYFDGIKLIS